ILPLEQDHDDEDDHQSACCQWRKQGSDDALDYLKWFRLRLRYLDRQRLCQFSRWIIAGGVARCCGGLGPRQLIAQVAQHCCSAMDDTGPRYDRGKRVNLGLEIVAI